MTDSTISRTGTTTRTLAAIGISAVAYAAASLAVASALSILGGGGSSVILAYPVGAVAGVLAARLACDRLLAAWWGRPVFVVFALVCIAFLVGIAANPDPADERIGNVLRFLATAATAWFAFWRRGAAAGRPSSGSR